MKLVLSADLLVAISRVLERVCSGAAKVKFDFQDYEIEAYLADKGQKINIEIRPKGKSDSDTTFIAWSLEEEESNAEKEGRA